MKFRENDWPRNKFESKAQYFEHRADINSNLCSGEIETLRAQVTYLQEVVGRLIQHLPLDLEQLSEIVDGYDRELEEIQE